MNKPQRKKLYKEMEYKYLAGQMEHGGDLSALNQSELLMNIEEELMDALFYIRQLMLNNKKK